MKTNLTDFYDEAEITMENNALDIQQIHQTIDIACREKYKRGKDHYGEKWVGQRGALEAYEEMIDTMVYLGLEREALLFGFDEDNDIMPKKMRTRLDVVEKIMDDIRGCITGLQLFIRMTEEDHQWGMIFPETNRE